MDLLGSDKLTCQYWIIMATYYKQDKEVRRKSHNDSTRLALTVFNWIDRLPDVVRESVMARCSTICLHPSEFLWSRGDNDYDLYQIIEGELHLYTLTEEGKKLLYITFTSGDCTGENGMIDGEARYHMAQAIKTMSVQIASRLCLLLDTALVDKQVVGEVDLQVTQEDIASMLGTTRQSVSRILAEWQSLGIINLRYGKIVVINPKALRQQKLD